MPTPFARFDDRSKRALALAQNEAVRLGHTWLGTEHIMLTIPEREDKVSILGEKLTVERDGTTATYASPGRPIAVISEVMIEYRPGPPPRPRHSARRRDVVRAPIRPRARALRPPLT